MASPEYADAECRYCRGCATHADILERSVPTSKTEWLIPSRTPRRHGPENSSAQRLDAFALNCLPHLE